MRVTLLRMSQLKRDDAYWMRLALKEARKAEKKGEVPVGAVAVLNREKIASAHNLSIQSSDPTAHAELVALRRAGLRLRNYRLSDIIMYVTKEPCAMCAGALVWARVRKVVFGCRDPQAGACGSLFDFSKVKNFNHSFEAHGGVLEQECRHLLVKFFRKKRA